MRLFAAGLTTLLLGLLLVPAVRAFARRVGMVAAPRKDRWHSQPTALLGGVGIFVAFALGLVAFPEAADDAVPVLIASALLFVVGLVDDVVQIRPLLKLSLQVGAAAIVVGSGIHLPWTHQPLVDGAITMLWLVGITNAVNLLDNMDGLAAGISAIACVFLSVTFVSNGQAEHAVLPALLGGAALGFLRYNFKPASIFMGDGGSMFLGSLLGGLALLSSYGRSRSVASVMMTPVLIMMIPILDTTLVTITRRLRGQPVSVGGRDHTSHRLVALGASERRAVVILYVLAAMSGLVSVVARSLEIDGLIAVVPAFAAVVGLVGFYLARVPIAQVNASERDADASSLKLALRWRPAEIALDVCLVGLAYLLAYLLRWDWSIPDQQLAILTSTVPIVVTLEMAILWASGVYRQLWGLARVEDLISIVAAAASSAVGAGVAVLLLYDFSGPSRGVLVLNVLVLLILLAASRLFFQILQAIILSPRAPETGKRRAVIYGAGSRGTFLLTEVLNAPGSDTTAVGFVDDLSMGAGRKLHGLPIFDPADVVALASRRAVEEVLVATRNVDQRLLDSFHEVGLSLRTLRVEIK